MCNQKLLFLVVSDEFQRVLCAKKKTNRLYKSITTSGVKTVYSDAIKL